MQLHRTGAGKQHTVLGWEMSGSRRCSGLSRESWVWWIEAVGTRGGWGLGALGALGALGGLGGLGCGVKVEASAPRKVYLTCPPTLKLQQPFSPKEVEPRLLALSLVLGCCGAPAE